MDSKGQGLSLEDVALSFLTSLPSAEGKEKQQEINRFVVWYGKERPINQISPLEVANYTELILAAGGDIARKLEPVKALLTYAKKEKYISTSLASHVRIKQASHKTTRSAKSTKQKKQLAMTAESRAQLKSQLAALEGEEQQVIQEIRLAAADKDFRENAPLAAAKERREHLDIRIQEIKTDLGNAALVEEEQPTEEIKVRLRSKVVLRDMASGIELTYTLVTKKEVNPVHMKISVESPIGKALLHQCQGDIVKVIAPAGEMCYQIERIE
jgi:transcription elongation factor GreA